MKEREITKANIQKLPEETTDSYQAFLVFARLQFGDRKLSHVAAITGYSEKAVNGWSADFNWVDRANILDAQEEIIIREDRMKLLKADNVRYAEKSREIKDKAFELGGKMVEAAQDLLSNIKFIDKIIETDKVETKDGRMIATHTQIIMKAKVSDIPRLADSGMRMTQLATGMPTEIIEINPFDISQIKTLSDEQIVAQIEFSDREIQKRSGDKKLKLVS